MEIVLKYKIAPNQYKFRYPRNFSCSEEGIFFRSNIAAKKMSNLLAIPLIIIVNSEASVPNVVDESLK